MEHHGEFFILFRNFFWLIFPIFGMIMGLLHMRQRHDRNKRVLDMIKTYADQGKEAPPELLAVLRDPDFDKPKSSRPNWIPVFLFGSLSAGFITLALLLAERTAEDMAPFLFVAVIMAGLCIGFLVNILSKKTGDGNSTR